MGTGTGGGKLRGSRGAKKRARAASKDSSDDDGTPGGFTILDHTMDMHGSGNGAAAVGHAGNEWVRRSTRASVPKRRLSLELSQADDED